MLKIYHNPRCAKSRKGLEYLKSRGIEFEVKNYMKEGLRAEEVREIFLKSSIKPSLLARTQDDYYKMYLKGKNFPMMNGFKFIDNPAIISNDPSWLAGISVLAIPPEKFGCGFLNSFFTMYKRNVTGFSGCRSIQRSFVSGRTMVNRIFYSRRTRFTAW